MTLIESCTKKFSSVLVISLVFISYIQKDRVKKLKSKYNDYVQQNGYQPNLSSIRGFQMNKARNFPQQKGGIIIQDNERCNFQEK